MTNTASTYGDEAEDQPDVQVGEDPGTVDADQGDSPAAPRTDELEAHPEGEPTPS